MNRRTIAASFLSVLQVAILIVAIGPRATFAQDPGISLLPDESGSIASKATWNFGGWFAGGFPPNYEVNLGDAHAHQSLEFYNAAIEVSRMLSVDHGPTLLRGRPEAIAEFIPFWLGYSPKQKITIYEPNNTYPTIATITSYSSHGVCVTPLLFRWNFTGPTGHRALPWIQLGAGLLWTGNEFPQPTGGKGSNTSRINFTPQVGIGENIFTNRSQSIDLAFKVIHISSAGLGESNPGIPVSLQFSVGYSWWK
jgi:lipid A 3-O-deacylase